MPKHNSDDDAARIMGDVQPLLVKYHIICFEKLVWTVNMILIGLLMVVKK